MFTDADCKACRRGATELAILASELDATREISGDHENGILVARVDCSKDRVLCNTFRADTLPHILLIENKEVWKYTALHSTMGTNQQNSDSVQINAQELK